MYMPLYAAVARRFCESSRHISRPCDLQPHQQRWLHTISPPKPHTIYKHFFARCVVLSIFPSWRRYTFLSHLTTKSKISVRWIKKLVAVTGGVYTSIQFYKLAIASVARRFCESSRHISRPYNIQPHQQRCVNKISRPKTPIPISDLYSQCVLSKYLPPIFPLGGDTPFCAFGYEIKDFYLTRKKTGRRYGRRVCIYTIL